MSPRSPPEGPGAAAGDFGAAPLASSALVLAAIAVAALRHRRPPSHQAAPLPPLPPTRQPLPPSPLPHRAAALPSPPLTPTRQPSSPPSHQAAPPFPSLPPGSPTPPLPSLPRDVPSPNSPLPPARCSGLPSPVSPLLSLGRPTKLALPLPRPRLLPWRSALREAPRTFSPCAAPCQVQSSTARSSSPVRCR